MLRQLWAIKLINQAARDVFWLFRWSHKTKEKNKILLWILVTDLLFVLAVYSLLFLLLYIHKVEYWFNSSFSLLSMVSCISYSNKEAAFLLEDQFNGPELSQHATNCFNNNFRLQIKEAAFLSEDCHLLTLTRTCWNYWTTHKRSVDQILFSCQRKKAPATRD